MNILQLSPMIAVKTPLGDGMAIMVIDYGMHANTCWVVALKKDGQIKHFDANDVKLAPNFIHQLAVKNR
jgi:hypothetical protein